MSDGASSNLVYSRAVPEDVAECIVVRGRTTAAQAELGHTRLFLGCSPDPESRSYGFYRHLGWRSTGTYDQYGDEILEMFVDG